MADNLIEHTLEDLIQEITPLMQQHSEGLAYLPGDKVGEVTLKLVGIDESDFAPLLNKATWSYFEALRRLMREAESYNQLLDNVHEVFNSIGVFFFVLGIRYQTARAADPRKE